MNYPVVVGASLGATVFFALATLLVKACDLLVGSPDPSSDETERA